MEMVVLYVRMDCNGCERTVRKALSKLKGVDSVDVDLKRNKVTVIGYVDRKKVLQTINKAGKKAEFWNQHLQYPSPQDPYMEGCSYPDSFATNYSYPRQGYTSGGLHSANNSGYPIKSRDEVPYQHLGSYNRYMAGGHSSEQRLPNGYTYQNQGNTSAPRGLLHRSMYPDSGLYSSDNSRQRYHDNNSRDGGPYPYSDSHNHRGHFHPQSTLITTQNYHRHGYGSTTFMENPAQSGASQDAALTLFSDENPNSCHIM
eukprot:c17062_g1_i1 orf=453-1223(-)